MIWSIMVLKSGWTQLKCCCTIIVIILLNCKRQKFRKSWNYYYYCWKFDEMMKKKEEIVLQISRDGRRGETLIFKITMGLYKIIQYFYVHLNFYNSFSKKEHFSTCCVILRRPMSNVAPSASLKLDTLKCIIRTWYSQVSLKKNEFNIYFDLNSRQNRYSFLCYIARRWLYDFFSFLQNYNNLKRIDNLSFN